MRDNGHNLPQEDSIPHARKAAPKPGLKKALRGSSAWYFLPAIAMLVTAGVTLDANSARAQTDVGNQNGTYVLGSGSPTGTPYFLGPMETIATTNGPALVMGTQNFFDYGVISTTDTAPAVTITGAGYFFNGGAAGSAAYGTTYGGGAIGTITSTSGPGIEAAGAATIVNQGYILADGNHVGVLLDAGGSVTNSGSIYGSNGVGIRTAAGYVTNTGTITGNPAVNGIGITLQLGGTVTNTGGTITGYQGINISGAAGIVLNTGTIIGSGANARGVYLGSGGSVNNGGTISGNTGVNSQSGDFTLTNTGTITGTGGTAVNILDNGTDRVILGAGYAFTGAISVATPASATLEWETLVNGTISNTAGLGFTNFGTIVVDAGATVNNNTSQTLASGYTLSNSGSITNSGILTGDGTVTNAGTFTNTSTGVITTTTGGSGFAFLQTAGTLINAGSIYGTISGVSASAGSIVNTGTINGGTADLTNAGVYLTGAAYVNNSSGTIAGYSGIIAHAGVATVNNGGTISSTGAAGFGVYLRAGGTVINQAGGTIYSPNIAVYATSAPATLINYGTILGANGHGARLLGGGSVYNSGTITGATGIYVYGVGTVTNAGTVTATGTDAVYLNNGGTITNLQAGTISGQTSGVKAYSAGIYVNNYGSINAAAGPGVYFRNGGVVNNYAGGTITGSQGIHSISSYEFTLTNYGVIKGLAGYGVYSSHGTITNSGTASYIYGLTNGVKAIGTVINQGTIKAVVNAGVYLNGAGTVINGISGTNYGTITSASAEGVELGTALATLLNYGTVSGVSGVTAAFAGDYILNEGTITGTAGEGVYLSNGGTVINGSSSNATAQITGTNYGVKLAASGTVINYGHIAGGTSQFDSGVYLKNGGSVSNAAGGTITGYYGVWANTGAGTVSNAGTIISTVSGGVGVYLKQGGTVSNTATTGTITGYTGVLINSALGTVKNSGTIIGTNYRAIYLGAGGYVGNLGVHARISGYYEGVYLGDAGSVFNQGTIIGNSSGGTTSAGVSLTNGGTVTNSGSASYIYGNVGVQISGSAGTINNAGTINASAHGVYATASAIITNGSTGLISAAHSQAVKLKGATSALTLTNYGTIIGAGGVYTSTSTAPSTIINSGLITSSSIFPGINAHAVIVVSNSGTIISATGTGVATSNGGTVGNTATTGTISGVLGVVMSGVASTVANQGTIIGTGGQAISLFAGGYVGNLGANAHISGYAEGVYINTAAGSVFNQGTIIGGTAGGIYAGVNLVNGGTVTNSGTAAYIYGNVGVQLAAGGAIANTGTINASAHGVYATGGTVFITNGSSSNSTALISATNSQAVKLKGGTSALNLTNYGTINGAGGVYTATSSATSTIINKGLITSHNTNPGISAHSVVVVTNTGTITGATGTGVAAQAGGSVSNTGVISGATGVSDAGTSFTLTNYGAITGTSGTAISLGATSNVLTLGTGSSETGAINGAAHVSAITLTGTNSITNTFTNFAAGSTLTVASGATWIASGSWTIPAVTNAGTLQPGVSGSPLNLTGNFAQGAGSALQSVLLSDGTGSKLAVTGAANISNSLSSIIEPAGLAGATTRTYTLVSATGGVTGMFSGVTGGTALLPATLSYDADDAYVTLTQRSIVSGTSGGGATPTGSGRTPDELALAQAFDAGYAANPVAFGPALGALDQIPTAAGVDAALDVISGQNNADLTDMAILQGFDFITLFQQHSFSTKGNTDQDDPWITGFAQSASQDGSPAGALHLNEGITGGIIGADHVFFPGFRLGLVGGMGEEHASVGNGGGLAKVNFEEGAATADYTDGNLYADLLLGYAYSHGTTTRNVSLPGLPGTATAHPKSDAILAGGEMGYTLVSDEVASLIPFVSFDYSSTRQHAFTETGGGALALAVTAHTDESERSVIGTRVNFSGWSIGDVPMTVETKIGWAHEFANLNPLLTESFAAQAGTSFTIAGAPLPGDSALVGLGLTAALSSNASIHLRYDGGYSSTTLSHMISGGISIDW